MRGRKRKGLAGFEKKHRNQSIWIDFAGDAGRKYKVYWVKDGRDPSHTVLEEITDPDFPTDKQIQFFESKAFYLLFGGGRGGGKTEAIVWDAIFRAWRCPGSDQVILRQTYGELDRTIIRRMKKLPAELVGSYHSGQEARHFGIPNGANIYLQSAENEDDMRKFLSGEFLTMYFDEWSEWEYRFWRFTTGSARSTIEKDIFGKAVMAQIKGASNPGGMGGDALNHLFGCDVPKSPAPGEDPESYNPDEYEFILSLVDDNPAFQADRPAGKAYRRMLAAQPRRVRDAWIYGKWSGFEGQYFDGYEEIKTQIPQSLVLKMIREQYWQTIVMGIDWGGSGGGDSGSSAYCCWCAMLAFQLRDGSSVQLPVLFRELLRKGIGEAAFAEEVADYCEERWRHRISSIFLSPETFGDSIHSRARRIGDVFESHMLPRPQIAYSTRVDGWSFLHDLMREEHQVIPFMGWEPRAMVYDEKENPISSNVGCAGLLVCENMELLLEAIPWAKADPKKQGDIIGKGSSPLLDVLDGTRYCITTHLAGNDRPQAEKLKDEILALPVEGSQRFMHWARHRKDGEETNAVYFHPPHRGRRGGRWLQ